MAILVFSLDDNGASGNVRVDFGGAILFEVSGTYVANVQVQESYDLQAWKVVDTQAGAFTQRYENTGPVQSAKYYRTVIRDYVSGTVDSTMTSFAADTDSEAASTGAKLAFSARRSAAQSVTVNTETVVLYTVTMINENAGTDSYNSGTGEYTFGQDRVVQITAAVKWATPVGAGTRSLMIAKNGTVIRAITDESQLGNSQVISSLEEFSTGDILTIVCFHSSETLDIASAAYIGNDAIWLNIVEV